MLKHTLKGSVRLLAILLTAHVTFAAAPAGDAIPGPAEQAREAAKNAPRRRPAPPAGLFVPTSVPHSVSDAVRQKLKERREGARARRQADVTGHYIITFKDDQFPYELSQPDGTPVAIARDGRTITDVARNLAATARGDLVHVYPVSGAFSAILTEPEAARLASLPEIESVEVEVIGQIKLDNNNYTWAFDRINERAAVKDHVYYTNKSGVGVHAYVIDSGIRGDHVDFTGRIDVAGSKSFVATDPSSDPLVDIVSGNGHGTSVASLIGGTYFGAAPSVTLHSYKVVFNAAGQVASGDVKAAIDWLVTHHAPTSVANISIGFSVSVPAINSSIQNLIASGVTVVVAAGNSSADAGTRTPSMVVEAITVGATDFNDQFAVFSSGQSSNYGAVLDLFAPGKGVTAATANGTLAANSALEGTSFASPIVAGAACLYLETHPSALADEVRNSLVINSTPNVVGGTLNGSPNRLVFTGPTWLDLNANIVAGSGTPSGNDIQHANGNYFDQVLLTGNTVTIHADPNQVVRCSWIDENDDIVQAEFSGSGNLTITLENPSGPALPAKYNQNVQYMKGKASFTISGATGNSNFTIFSVGRGTAVNQALFINGMNYDGFADVKNIQFQESQRISRIGAANARFTGTSGIVGIYGPQTKVDLVMNVFDIDASGSATPYLLSAAPSSIAVNGGRPIVAGGDLIQTNGQRVNVAPPGGSSGFSALYTNWNTDSHNNARPPLSLASARLGAGPSPSTAIILPFACGSAGAFTPPAAGNTAP